MYRDEAEFQEMLESAGMNVVPDPSHIWAVQKRMAVLARNRAVVRRRTRNACLVVLLLCGVGGTALAATETGRCLVRWILTPILPRHEMTVTTPDGATWTSGGSTKPYGPPQRQAAADLFAEIARLSHAGRGELVALREGPEGTAYSIGYTLHDGTFTTVATGAPTDAQILMLRIDEIQRLRDAGAGDLLVESPSPYGLGCYTIRFALADRTVDLETWYPPGPRAEREAIFGETRRLKAELQFTVAEASANVQRPEAGITGTLRYTLSDGRTVGIVERIPDELITADSAHVLTPGTGEALPIGPGGFWTGPDGNLFVTVGGDGKEDPHRQVRTLDRYRRIAAIKQAGGGRLVGLRERPGGNGEPGTTTFQVMYDLDDGESTRVAEVDLSGPQRASMRVDEILRLRDAGAGEIIAQRASPLGLGGFTIRLRLADGETVDLHTLYPPGTRQQREAIFAETRTLKAKRRFTVHEPRVLPGSGLWGILRYTLADGRSVSHFEQVPSDLITADGRYVAIPGTDDLVEIARTVQK